MTDKLTQRLEEGDNLLDQQPTAYQQTLADTNEWVARCELRQAGLRAEIEYLTTPEKKAREAQILKELGF